MTVSYRPPTIRKRKNEKAEERRWQPLDWEGEYEEIVDLHCKGMGNGFLADKFKLTLVQISNILHCKEAKAIKAQYIEHLRKISFDTAEQGLIACQTRAMENMTNILNNEQLLSDSPFGMFDRSMSFLKSTGKLIAEKPVEPANVVNNNTTVVFAALDQIKTGLKAAEDARRLNSGVTGASIN